MTAAHTRSAFIEPTVAAYAAAHTTPPDDVQTQLRNVTEARTGALAGMQIGDDQAVLLELVVRAIGAVRAVEIGTFTGSSALAIARGLGPGGRLLCCDVNEEWTAIAREHWVLAGVDDRIDLRLAPASETLAALPNDDVFDFAFVDADKTGYLDYYEQLVPRLRTGGLLVADNTLQSGRVAHPAADDDNTRAIRAFNDRVLDDARVRSVLLPIGDGVTMVQRVD